MKKKSLIIIPVLVGLMLVAFIYSASVTSKLKVGDTAPNIQLKSFENKTLELKSLRGKIVLVDFWASWCGACRKENQNIVRAFNKNKDQKYRDASGFTIYSVSLDTDTNIWKKAIKIDKLAWPNHVSDFKKWDTQSAVDYGVTALPSNFLLDADGKIIATDLSGSLLETELEKLVKK